MFGFGDFIDNKIGQYHWYRKLTRGNWYLVEWTFPYNEVKKENSRNLPAIRKAVKEMNVDGKFPRWQRHSYGRPVDYLWIIIDKEIYKGELNREYISGEEKKVIEIENKLFERNKRIDKLTKTEQ